MYSNTRLFVGNLPDNTVEKDIKTVFSAFGDVTNLDLKCKSGEENNKKNFAFVTISASNHDVETCIKYFTNEDFMGKRLYVTRARESFLERLQRERLEGEKKEPEQLQKPDGPPKKNPILKLGDRLNPQKRRFEPTNTNDIHQNKRHKVKFEKANNALPELSGDGVKIIQPEANMKKQDSDKKRMDSMRKKRQEFREKQNIIKTGLVGIDNMPNKKKKFSDNEDELTHPQDKTPINDVYYNKRVQEKSNNLFFDDDSGDEVNFEIKKQFEGKKGQKVLDLQSRYKSDKRFVLDERFVEDQSEEENDEAQGIEDEKIDIGTTDEKAKQLNILQDVLGVSIKMVTNDSVNKQSKSKLGMLRFDPTHPEHAKFLAPIEDKQESTKKARKIKSKEEDVAPELPQQEVQKVNVSKEQFYKVSDTLKEAIAQPTSFSLRSLFINKEEDSKIDEHTSQVHDYIPLAVPKERKTKNPLEPGERNPFVYDSSDSELDDNNDELPKGPIVEKTEIKHVWQENLFFTVSDHRLKEGLAFFNKTIGNEGQKERRELKSLMKKRIYNKERKNQMFQKKIGGKRKTMKKNFKRKS